MAPDESTSIVQTGPYAFTRNPMYLGMALAILGYCAYLTNPISIVAVIGFVAYITVFQIVPEERALRHKFGESYAAYSKKVRRWI
jgi:protein-S-isoprenylcysteine O-methyltransferase Ste14